MVDISRRSTLAALGTVALPVPSAGPDDDGEEGDAEGADSGGGKVLPKSTLPDAERVIISLPEGISIQPPLAGHFDDLLGEQLIGRRVWEGETVPCQLDDWAAIVLPVRSTDPDRLCVVRGDTTVGVREPSSD